MNTDQARLQKMMDAASALTVLAEDNGGKNDTKTSEIKTDEASSEQSKEQQKRRYLPDHKKPDAAPTFPEKLMAMMRYAESQGDSFCVRWLEDGKSFIIDDSDTFTKKVVPQYFKPTKFSSFTRKLYRWGFRQLNRGMGQDDPVIFGNVYFQRNKPELMAKMKSTTAAATRKAEEEIALSKSNSVVCGMKRPAEIGQIELQQQLLLSELLRKKGNYENPASTFVPSVTPAHSAHVYPSSVAPMGNQRRPVLNAHDLSLTKMMYPSANLTLNSPRYLSPARDTSLLSQFIPRNTVNPVVGMPSLTGPPQSLQFTPTAATTAEIVNAAIQALKNA